MYPPLCNISAVKFWTVYGAPDMPTAYPIPTPTHFDPPDSELMQRLQSIPALQLGEPLHFLCRDSKQRRHAANVICHAREVLPPRHSVFSFGNELSVVSPELSFLEMGNVYPVERLSQYGTMLCGKYGIKTATQDASSIKSTRFATDLFKRTPVTSRELVESYLASCHSLHGRTIARRAFPYVFDRSRSPMETATVLLLSMPYHYGGRNLPQPQLNIPVAIKQPMQVRNWNGSISALDAFECDLVWHSKRGIVVVEYQGELGHSGESNIHRDARKHNALENSGIKVRALTKETLLDYELFTGFANDLAKLLRCYRKSKLSDIDKRQKALHRLLLGKYLTMRVF